MTGFVMVIHSLICILLVTVVLMQSGRGGGLTEGFASAESMFGAQTSAFMIKMTTIFATLFFVTCLSLAVLSTNKNKSLMTKQSVAVSKDVVDQVPAGAVLPSATDTPLAPIGSSQPAAQQSAPISDL